MKNIYYLYICIFLLEICGFIPPIELNSSMELRVTILFEIFFAMKTILHLKKTKKIIKSTSAFGLFLLTILVFSVITYSKSYFVPSLVVGTRLALMLSVAFIPVIYNFTLADLNKAFELIKKFILLYVIYTIGLYFFEGHVGQRFFGPMGDSFGWVLSIFCFSSYVSRKWGLFILYLGVLAGICASLGAILFLVCTIFYYHYRAKRFKYLFISFFVGISIIVTLILAFPNIILNSAYGARFSKQNKDISSADASLMLRNESLDINISEMRKNFFLPEGTGSTSFVAAGLGDKFQGLNELNFYVIASLPISEIFRVVREWGVYGLVIYLIFSLSMIKYIHTKQFAINELNYQVLAYYFVIFFIFNMILFLPGSILLFLFGIFLAFYIRDIYGTAVRKKRVILQQLEH